jgi:hypothetical protein
MKLFTLNTQRFLPLAAFATAAVLISCSGGKRETLISESVKPMASVRTGFEQVEFMEMATGLSRSSTNVQSALTQRGSMLSPTGGESVSATLLQGTLDLAAAFCIDAEIAATAKAPQKVFPSYVDMSKNPTLAAHPENTVLRPLAVHLLQQFSGEAADPEEVVILVNAMKSFFEVIATEGPGGSAGTKRAMTAACITAAVSFNGLLSR